MNQDLSVIKGTSRYITVDLTDNDGNVYKLESGDKLIFGVKRDRYSTAYIIKKTLTADDELDGKYTFALTPEDTNIFPCRYFYDIGLQFSDGEFQMVVPLSIFYIEGAVTAKE